jgi:hypothetical protein
VVTKDEALKLALEALEWTLPLIEDFGNKEQLNKQHKAIASLYEALAQPAQKTATGIQYAQGIPFFIPPAAQPAQPAQEPRLDQGPDYERGFVDGMLYQTQTSVDKAVNAIAQPAQEPMQGTPFGGMNRDDWKDVVSAISKVRDSRGIYLACKPADVFQDWFLLFGAGKLKEKNT